MTLEDINEFVVPTELIEMTLETLRDAGSKGFEAFVLWGGEISDDGLTFTFGSVFVPEQTTSRTEDGLLVVVDGDALFRVNKAFYDQGLILGGQVHSHPTDAYHSATDDLHPMMTLVGGLSVVVPDFGKDGTLALDRWAWYRLAGPGRWEPLDQRTELRIS